MNHYPYFEGSLDAVCGKRVAFDRAAVDGRVECPACRQVLEERVTSGRHCADKVAKGTQGYALNDADHNAKVISTWRKDADRIEAILAR